MVMNVPKISVIVPVYKAETYLHRCVDSLLAQTFTDFEILLVDDGSPDRSGEISDEYARKDSRVRVFHKENGGVSSARQCGMDNARGEYTIHADPDDWVDPTMLEELYRKAKEEDADMVICDFYEERKNKTIYVRQQPSALDHETVLCELFQQLHGSCWNKLVRRACYVKYGVRFPLELSCCEDLYVNACLAAEDIRITYLNKAFYHYDQVINENSILHSNDFEFFLQIDRILIGLLEERLDNSSFSSISLMLNFRLANKHLILGGEYLHSFKEDFRQLKGNLRQLPISRNSRLVLWVAFNVSPYMAHLIYRVWLMVN